MTHPTRIALLAAMMVLFTALPAAAGPTVLLIWDIKGPLVESLDKTLTQAGIKVVYSDTNESGWNGQNPGLDNIDVVVHLNGTTYNTEMPKPGQRALVDFVKAGGGYIHHEWNSYQLGLRQMTAMREIILFDRTSGYAGDIIITRTEQTSDIHPVTWEVPPSFTMRGSCNIGKAHVFKENPVVVLAQDQNGNDAIAVRELALGRVVGFHHGGNWEHATQGQILASREARQLFVDAVRWSHGCGKYFRKGLRDGICKQIEARK
jgi:hypothetical protein